MQHKQEQSSESISKARQILPILLGSTFSASLPWTFILLIPQSAYFYLLQPIPLMFVTYPVIYILAGYLIRRHQINVLLAGLAFLTASVIVLTAAIAWAAAVYSFLYLIFLFLGYWGAGFQSAKKGKSTR